MNPNDIRETGWMFSFFLEAAEWLKPIVYLVGLSVAVWAFLRCRKRGFIVVGFYFVLLLFSLWAMPSINRAIRAHHAPDVSEQTQRKMDEAVQQAVDRVLEQEGHPVMVAKRTLHFPLDAIVLVVGLWLVARHEPRMDRSNVRRKSSP